MINWQAIYKMVAASLIVSGCLWAVTHWPGG